MKGQILLLIELQKNDLEMKETKIKGKKLPDNIVELDTKIQSFEDNVRGEKVRFEELNAIHTEKEENLKRGIEVLKKSKNRLLEIKTNKEYHAMLKEIETVEEKNSEIEDAIIYILEEIDTARERLKSKEEELSAYRLKHEKMRSEIEKEINSIDSKLLTCQKKIDDVRGKIDKDLLKKYEIIKEKRNDLAVVSVWNGVCGGCHMNIPPQMYNELQKFEELILCPTCNRIIHWSDIDKN